MEEETQEQRKGEPDTKSKGTTNTSKQEHTKDNSTTTRRTGILKENLSLSLSEILRIIIYHLQQARDCTLQDDVAFVYGVLSVCLQSWNASMTNLITKTLPKPKSSRRIYTK